MIIDGHGRAAELRAAALTSARDDPGGRPCGGSREVGFTAHELRAEQVERDGKQLHHLHGEATVFETGYDMWDKFGPYQEVVSRGAGDATLARNPDVAFLVNHRGVTMARTTTGTLVLAATDRAMLSDAYLNPAREDVKTLISAVEDKLVTEMSFAFMIPDGGGEWSDDFAVYRINQFDIHRGDVSAVNYGANPYTTISGRSREIILHELDALPTGAARAALDRLRAREDVTAQIRAASIAQAGSSSAVATYETLVEALERRPR